MSDTIGRIPVPTPTPSGLTFPLVSEYPFGLTQDWRVVEHRFGSDATMASQRFGIGSGALKFQFAKSVLSTTDRTNLVNFYEAVEGSYQSFLYNSPNPNNTTTGYQVVFETQPLSITDLVTHCQSGTTFIEIANPSSAPSYSISETVLRFPNSSLLTALTSQVQQIIPLIHIQVRDTTVPQIYLSDRRLTLAGQLYLPRVTGLGEAGSNIIMSQDIKGSSDNIQFSFGNADRVMSQLAVNTSLQFAEIDLSLYHVGTGILLQLWKGIILDWHGDGTATFTTRCSDGLYPTGQNYPRRQVSRSCWKTFNDGVNCPWATTPGHTGNGSSCDFGYDTVNGCLSHGMSIFYGAHPEMPQSVIIKDDSTGVLGFGRSIVTSTSIVSDSIWGQPLPEIWCNDYGNPQYAFWANALMVAVRDESTYEDTLGIIGVGPLGLYEGMSVQTTADGYQFIVAPLADGFPPQGFVVNGNYQVTRYQPTLGLRQILGTDPVVPQTDAFSLGQAASSPGGGIVIGQRYDVPNPPIPGGGGGFSNILTGQTNDILPFAAGTAFVELRYAKSASGGIAPSTAESHSMTVPISKGLTGVTFSTGGTPTQVPGLVNPFWIAVNTYLRAIGINNASTSQQLAAFVLSSLVSTDGISGCAQIADLQVPPIVGLGQITYFNTTSGDAVFGVINNTAGTYSYWSPGSYPPTPGGIYPNITVPTPTVITLASAESLGYVSQNSLTGTETQFQFQGTLTQFKPFRDWMIEILNCCLGYFCFEFGALKLGCRSNAIPTASFDYANMLYQSLSVQPVRSAMMGGQSGIEYLKIDFADAELQGQQNEAEYQDKDHANYMGRAGAPLTATIRSVGLAYISQALRICTTRVREELGGILRTDLNGGSPNLVYPATIEFDNFNEVMFKTTIMALDTEIGQVISVTNPDISTYPGPFSGQTNGNPPGPFEANTWPYRITKWTLHQDFSVTITARSVTDSMYQLEIGPQPTASTPPAIPVLFYPEPLGQWAPYSVQAPSTDALWPNEWSFGVSQNGAAETVSGAQPINQFIPECGYPDPKQGAITINSSGGSLPAGTTFYIQVCAANTSASGAQYSPPSPVLVVQTPSAGGNTYSITLTDILWPVAPGLNKWLVFASTSEDLICFQQSGTLSGSGTSGYTPTSITITGPFARSTYAVPNNAVTSVEAYGQRCIHAGVEGSGVDSLTSTTIVSSAVIDTTGEDNWAGRVLIMLTGPFVSFDITGFQASTGTFTLAQDPVTAGVEAGDVFAVSFLGYNNSPNPTVITDSGQSNATNGHTGELPDDPQLVGASILVIAGTNRGSSAKIISNTAISYTLGTPLPIDATSVYIVVAGAVETNASVPVSNSDPFAQTQINLNVTNFGDTAMIVTGALVEVNDSTTITSGGPNAPIRLTWVTAAAGVTPLADNVTGSGTVTILYPVYGGVQNWALQIPVTLPTSVSALSYLIAYINGPLISITAATNAHPIVLTIANTGAATQVVAGQQIEIVEATATQYNGYYTVASVTVSGSNLLVTLNNLTSPGATWSGTGYLDLYQGPRAISGQIFGPFTGGASFLVNSSNLGPNPPFNVLYQNVEIVVFNSENEPTPSPYTTNDFTVIGSEPALSVTYSGSFGIVGAAFSGSFAGSGGVPPYTFTVLSGSLPPGVSLETAAGVPVSGIGAGSLYGTPTTPGITPFNVQIEDSTGNTDDTTGSIAIYPSSTGPYTDVVTGLTITVVYYLGVNGQYKFQLQGSFTKPTDPYYAYAIAGVFEYGTTPSPSNPGFALAAAVSPAINGWFGPEIDVLPTTEQYVVYVWCISTAGYQSTNNTNTSAAPITISLSLAQAYLGGSTTVPVPNGTLTSATAYYPGITVDGMEQVQFQFVGTVPASANVQGMGLFLCPICYFRGAGAIGTAFPSESSGYSGGTVNIYVNPWYPTGLSCIVAGLTGVDYAQATFTISGGTISPGLTNNYCLIDNLLCHVSEWLTPNTFMIDTVQGGSLANGTFSFAGQEARYGMAIGDTLSDGQESFTLTGLQAGYAEIGTLALVSGVWVSGWVVTRSAGAHPSYAANQILASIASTSETAGKQLGFMAQGQTTATSANYPVGLPTAYATYGVPLSTTNTYNPWPLLGVTPVAIIGTVEAQTPGSIAGNRLAAITLHPSVGVIGNLLTSTSLGPSEIYNGTFAGNPGTQPIGWYNTPNVPITRSFSGGVPNGNWFINNTITPPSGSGQELLINANGDIVSAGIACLPNQQWGLYLAVLGLGSGISPGSVLEIVLGYYGATGNYISSASTSITAASTVDIWTQIPAAPNFLSAPAPSGAAYVYVGFAVTGLTAGSWLIANVTLQLIIPAPLMQLTSPLGPNSLGQATVLNDSIAEQQMASDSIGSAQIQLGAVESEHLATGAAAGNITTGTLSAGVIDAANGVIVNLVALNETIANQLVAQSVVLTSGAYTLTFNADGIALSIYNSTTGCTITLTNGTVNITQGGSTLSMEITSTPLSGPSIQVQNGEFTAVLNVNPGVGATLGAFNGLSNIATLFVNGANTGMFLSPSALASFSPSNGTFAISDGTGGFVSGNLYLRISGAWVWIEP